MSSETGWVPEDDFAARLLLARKHAGLTVKEAALRCGLHYATWSTWERGARPADMLSIVEQISGGLGVSRDWLAWGGALTPARGIELRHPGRVTRANGRSSSRCTHSPAHRNGRRPTRRARGLIHLHSDRRASLGVVNRRGARCAA